MRGQQHRGLVLGSGIRNATLKLHSIALIRFTQRSLHVDSELVCLEITVNKVLVDTNFKKEDRGARARGAIWNDSVIVCKDLPR